MKNASQITAKDFQAAAGLLDGFNVTPLSGKIYIFVYPGLWVTSDGVFQEDGSTPATAEQMAALEKHIGDSCDEANGGQ